MNPNKPKGFSVDRLLNDPMAMFGALGAMGVLVVGVWIAVGSPGTKDEDGPDGGFQAAPTKSAAGRAAAAVVGSSLKVAKLKTPGAARAEGAEGLKDAQGSASAGSDGFLHGTLAEIEAAEKAKKTVETAPVADAASPQASKKPIPVEVAGGAHVPGAAPDSTRLAAMAKGNFGPSSNLNNSDFAGGIGTGGGAGAAPASTSFEAGAPANPELGEGGPLLAANPAVPGKASVGGSRQFLRGQTVGAGVPAGAAGAPGAARRASGGLGAGAGGTTGSLSGGLGSDFASGGTSFSPGGAGGGSASGGSASASAEASGGDRPAAVGGGAPKAAGMSGMGGGAKNNLADGAGGSFAKSSSAKAPAAASKTELSDQAKKHFALAERYRSGVVIPLTQREQRHAATTVAKLGQASGVLASLDRQLGVELAFFAGYPAALAPLSGSRALIATGGSSLKRRLDSAQAEMTEGSARVEWVPQNCDFRPIVYDKVWNPWNGDQEDWQWRRNHRGDPLTLKDGRPGHWEDVPRHLDINGVATSGQDLLEGAARRAANVRQEALAGVRMVDAEFNPAIQVVAAANAAAGARLNSVAGRIKDDLNRVAGYLPERVTETVAAEASNHGKLQQSALRGHEDVKDLVLVVNERRLGYPDGPARDALDRNMADASRSSGEALGAVNTLAGTSSDTMFALTEAARGATSALQSLCYSRDRLNDLSAKAK